MKCRNYKTCKGKTRSPQKKWCWTKFRLCGLCSVKEHPELYSPAFVANRLCMERKGLLGPKRIQQPKKAVAFLE